MVNWEDKEEVREYYRQNYLKNKDRKSAQNKIWRDNNGESVKAGKKKWAKENRKKRLKSCRKWREKNVEKIKRDRVRDKDKIEIAWKKWSSKNQENISQQKKDYYNNNRKELLRKRKINYIKNKTNECLICGKASNYKYCSIQCCGTDNSGEKCVLWRGGLSFELYGKEWNNKFRQSIRDRDDHVCMLCTQPEIVFNKALAIHHINGIKTNSVKENCISLCNSCHANIEKDKTRKKEYYEPLFYSMLKKLYNY